jgi:L-asparaginase/Glu-tRNA(Gln) amidotransferase subunit D
MAYAASALSFLLENLSKPVVITGSMLPLSDLFHDAGRNLVVSLVLAGALNVPEVRALHVTLSAVALGWL